MSEINNPYTLSDRPGFWYDYLTQPWTEQVLESSRFQILLAACICCLFYYLLYVVHKPTLVSAGGVFAEKLRANVSALEEYYWPTVWCFGAHLQTIGRVLLKPKPYVPYEREEIKTSDGGILSLHWVYNDEQNHIFPDPKCRPTFLLLPGLTGQYDASYCINLVSTATKLGYRSVVHHNRGIDVALKTPKTFSATNTEDLKFVLAYIQKRYPKSPVIAAGVSLGGIILTHYLCEVKDTMQSIFAAFIVSAPWNCFESTKSLESPLNWLLFNRHLTWTLRRLVRRNYHVFKESKEDLPYDVDDVLKAKTIRDYDNAFICPMFGYQDWKEYYSAVNLDARPLETISVPTLYLNAEDDPFAPGHTIPLEKIGKCNSVALALMKYGGHIGFIEGFFVRSYSLVEKLFEQFASYTLKEKSQSEYDTSSEIM